MKANEYQIDGKHYKTAYEHWDYALDAGLGSMEYAATKHLGRFHKKGEPIMDLEKALHYVQKLLENVTLVMFLCPRDRFTSEYLSEVADRFIEASEIPEGIDTAVLLLTYWTLPSDLYDAMDHIQEELAAQRAAMESLKDAKPVPLEDSNKHAPRSTM